MQERMSLSRLVENMIQKLNSNDNSFENLKFPLLSERGGTPYMKVKMKIDSL